VGSQEVGVSGSTGNRTHARCWLRGVLQQPHTRAWAMTGVGRMVSQTSCVLMPLGRHAGSGASACSSLAVSTPIGPSSQRLPLSGPSFVLPADPVHPDHGQPAGHSPPSLRGPRPALPRWPPGAAGGRAEGRCCAERVTPSKCVPPVRARTRGRGGVSNCDPHGPPCAATTTGHAAECRALHLETRTHMAGVTSSWPPAPYCLAPTDRW
jgi:hypothetical protein